MDSACFQVDHLQHHRHHNHLQTDFLQCIFFLVIKLYLHQNTIYANLSFQSGNHHPLHQDSFLLKSFLEMAGFEAELDTVKGIG